VLPVRYARAAHSRKEIKMASNPLLKFRDEILIQVVYPKLYAILTSNKGDISINDLWKEFRKLFECPVSLREFKEWCGELGLQQGQVIRWDIPENFNKVRYQEITPTTNKAFTPTDEDLDEILFDNET